MSAAGSRMRPVLIMAGGTGGHVFPALAVARELSALGVPVSWLGTRRGLEARVVPAAGFPLNLIRVTGLRGKGALRLLLAPFMLLFAMLQALVVFLRIRPAAVLGMGGFTAGPGGVVAWLLRRPLLIHEQNSVPGTTNRLLAPLAKRVLEGFPGSLPARYQPLHTGNPVRADIAALPGPSERFRGREGELRLLVVGGSLGAQVLNRVVPEAVAGLPEGLSLRVHHQTGRADEAAVREHYAALGDAARVEAFIDDMAAAYAACDVAVCRSGASSMSELAYVAMPSILVPYPYAADDHQTVNARVFEHAGAAVMRQEAELDAGELVADLTRMVEDEEVMREMSSRADGLALKDAAAKICDEISVDVLT